MLFVGNDEEMGQLFELFAVVTYSGKLDSGLQVIDSVGIQIVEVNFGKLWVRRPKPGMGILSLHF